MHYRNVNEHERFNGQILRFWAVYRLTLDHSNAVSAAITTFSLRKGRPTDPHQPRKTENESDATKSQNAGVQNHKQMQLTRENN
jgi:hypothetical protein